MDAVCALLGDDVDDTAGRARPIKDGAIAFDHLDIGDIFSRHQRGIELSVDRRVKRNAIEKNRRMA